MEKRNEFFDIIKALGIVSIVYGHSCWNMVSKFCYSYHLAIFFFVSGLLFKPREDVGQSIYRKVKPLWLSYTAYFFCLLAFHNLFVRSGILAGAPYRWVDYLTSTVNALFFSQGELFGGAMWFVPFFAVASVAFILLEHGSRTIAGKWRIPAKPALIALCLLGGAYGLYLTEIGYQAAYYASLSFMMLPIYLLGYLIRSCNINLEKLLVFPGFALSVAGIYFIFQQTNNCIELSAYQIVSPALFYPITLMGIYICCYLAKCVLRIPKASAWFARIGSYTFDIMAMHFFFLKLVDLLYTRLVTKDDSSLANFPHTYGYEMLPFYLVAGVLGPVLLRKTVSLALSAAGKGFAHARRADSGQTP